MSAYLALKDSKNIPRSETLIIDYNMIQNSNLAKPYIQNRTTTNKVEVIMLSGKSFEIPIGNVHSVLDLKSEVVIRIFEHCKRPKSKFHLLQLKVCLDHNIQKESALALGAATSTFAKVRNP